MKKEMAIVCNYSLMPDRIGGMDRFYIAYDKAAKALGYEIDWFFSKHFALDFYKDFTIYSDDNYNVEHLFLRHCEENKVTYDIVITHFLQPISSFFKIIKKLNPSIYIINVDHNPRPLNGFIFKKRVKNKIKGLLYGKYVDKLIGVSNYTSESILKDFGHHLKNKIATIHNGIDIRSCEKQRLGRGQKTFKFIVVSHLRESKGIQDLLKALSLLDEEVKSILSIDIFGEGPYEKVLIKLQKTYQLEGIIEFKGSSSLINQTLKNYHYLIQPTYMECFSLSLLESLACNVPVITTNVGGNTELVEDGVNGFIFSPKDANKLASIIYGIINGQLKIDTDVSELVAKKFTLDCMVNSHIKLLRACK